MSNYEINRNQGNEYNDELEHNFEKEYRHNDEPGHNFEKGHKHNEGLDHKDLAVDASKYYTSMISAILNIKSGRPLIHCITNHVTINALANSVLAIGARPIMAEDEEDAVEIAYIEDGLVLNLGNIRAFDSMLMAGRVASGRSIPIVLDPVGAGASSKRLRLARKLIEELDITVIKGNSSEIKALATGSKNKSGVDADSTDKISDKSLCSMIELARGYSEETGAIVVITGEIDIVAYRDEVYTLRCGNPLMSSVTGCGCILSGLICSFLAANKLKISRTHVTACAVGAMGIAAEDAFENLLENEGNMSYGIRIIDSIFNLEKILSVMRKECDEGR